MWVPLAASVGLLALPAAAEARVDITTPSLVPRYSEAVSDFTVKCSSPVEFRVTAGPAEKVSVDGRRFQGGAFLETVPLRSGQGLAIEVRRDGRVRSQFVRCLPDDFPLWSTTVSGSPRFGWYVVVPNFRLAPARRLPVFGVPYVAVVNRQGVPLWWFREPDAPPLDAKFVSGKELAWAVFRNGEPYRLRRLDGRLVRTIGTRSSATNYHELEPTRDGGFLALGDELRDCPRVPSECVDLTRWGGPAQATVIDNVVEKLDRGGRLVWRWTTKGNVDPDEAGRWVSHPSLTPLVQEDGRVAYDLFHANSVEEAGRGAIISLRHADAVYRTGDRGRGVRWKLGGTPTPRSLKLSGGVTGVRAFSGQHDARLLADGTISLFENGSFEPRPPRAVRYRIRNGSATLVESLSDSRATFSFGNGSARREAGGNWAISWGAGNSLFTEMTPRGRSVLALEFPDGLFSYRVDALGPGRLKASDLRAGMDAQYPR